MLEEVEKTLDEAEAAQGKWAAAMVRKRMQCIGRIPAELIARQSELLTAIARPNASEAEKLASEILPTADACRFVAKNGRQILVPKHGSIFNASWWMGWVSVTTIRQPWGTVLILGPSNYPLFLPAVQIVQALAAGNAVIVKPAPGCSEIMRLFRQCCIAAKIPEALIHILPESIEAAQEVIRQGIDKVLLTGSVPTGRAVSRKLAETLTPSTMELSGCDAVFILPQADLKRAAQAVAFALRLNGGATCIAPRRIFLTQDSKAEFTELLLAEVGEGAQAWHVSRPAFAATMQAAQQAVAQGAVVLTGEIKDEDSEPCMQPLVLDQVTAEMPVARSDLFAPITSLITVPDMTAAVAADQECPYSLGLSVFGPRSYAEHWASEVEAGCVVINDIVVPTADPRVAFGGHGNSGWGVTRGPEGLLEMTRPKVICTRRGRWLPHLDANTSGNVEILSEMLKLFHARTLRARFAAMRTIVKLGRKK